MTTTTTTTMISVLLMIIPSRPDHGKDSCPSPWTKQASTYGVLRTVEPVNIHLLA